MAKPIVVAVDGEARRVVERARAGRFADPGDSDALHEAIAGLLADPASLPAYGERGREFVAREFNRQTLARRYLEVLQGLVDPAKA